MTVSKVRALIGPLLYWGGRASCCSVRMHMTLDNMKIDDVSMPMIRVALRLDRDLRDWMVQGNRGIDARPRHFERPPFMSGIYPREGDHRNARHNALLVSRHIVIRGDPIGPLDIGRAGREREAILMLQICQCRSGARPSSSRVAFLRSWRGGRTRKP